MQRVSIPRLHALPLCDPSFVHTILWLLVSSSDRVLVSNSGGGVPITA
jgi:hypothetical protein